MIASVPLASAVLAVLNPAHAQDERSEGAVLDQVVVTAQKREENLQTVPLSIQAFGTEQLEELNINDFEDYIKYLPSVSFTSLGPGFALPYFRGVASGENNNHSGPLPTVGMYLDEQPITTIQGPLDIHLYDIARVEALAGPQGTLYGASSEAGTIRIITNKPDPSGFQAGYGVEGNYMSEGGTGYLAEAFANIPLTENSAIRLVGWYRHDAGYIDNIPGERTFPSSDVTINNADRAEEDYNDVDTYGLRAALKIDLNENWSITPTVMGQEQKANGSFGFDTSVGELQLTHFYPEESKDRWVQAALTVEGRIGNFDMTYAGSYLDRDVDTHSDYSDYSYWYDVVYSYGYYITNNAGEYINPSQFITGKDRYKRQAHELRFTSPADKRLRFVGGLFFQRQEHEIEQRYRINEFNDTLEVTGWDDTLWLTEQLRIDRDMAVFGELTFDITDRLSATAGLRYFETENSLEGFFGFGQGYTELVGFGRPQGEAACPGGSADDPDFTNGLNAAPCTNLDKVTKDEDTIEKLNLTYQFTDDFMGYVTYSRGFRPGGINRRATLPPYQSDFLTSYEAGWKTTWGGNRLRFNGAVFLQQWDDFQFSILGANGLTEIKNANQAEIQGLEADLTWAASEILTLSGGFAYLESELTAPYCGVTDVNGSPIATDPCTDPESGDTFAPLAPEGTQLPIVPEFKANLTARFDFPMGDFDAHVQASGVYTGERTSDLRLAEREILGDMPSYTLADLAFGIENDDWSIELFVSNVTDERAVLYKTVQCSESICGAQQYVYTTQPRTIGLKFGQQF